MSLFAANVLVLTMLRMRDSNGRTSLVSTKPTSSEQKNKPSSFAQHIAITHLSTEKHIKVIPYVNACHVLGLVALVAWPILLGTAFNIYAFKEASEYMEVRLDVEKYQERFLDVQNTVSELVNQQTLILSALRDPNKSVHQSIGQFHAVAARNLNRLNDKYPELSSLHSRVTPTTVLTSLFDWVKIVSNSIDPVYVIMNVTAVINKVKEFYAVHHMTSLEGGETWNNILQELLPGEIVYRVSDARSLGMFAYDSTNLDSPMDAYFRLFLIQRYLQAMFGLQLLEKYTIGPFKSDNLKTNCRRCNWTYPRLQNFSYWHSFLPEAAYLDDNGKFQDLLGKLQSFYRFTNPNASTVLSTLLSDALYPAQQSLSAAENTVGDVFIEDLDVSAAVFAILLGILIAWLILVANLCGLFAASLSSIFAESYRFQWIQLCRRRAIEREKTRSDKVVSEMFFEVNFKHLYEGRLPPMVLYSHATIAFVELVQYEELCKIYSTMDHVAILDWYYHLVSTAVKRFSVNLVATTGRYCLLASTSDYHAEDVALALLRLMTLARESFLPAPHQSRLPLIKGGMHSGRVAGAIVSLKFPLFTMLGDTVNSAARMNSKSKPFLVLMSAAVHTIIHSNFGTQEAGTFHIKGKGEMVAFWLVSCNWDAFSANKIDLREADDLARQHNFETHGVRDARHAQTAVGRSTQYDHHWSSLGTGRGSSFSSSAAAQLGDTLLQGLLKAKKRKQKRTKSNKDRLLLETKVPPASITSTIPVNSMIDTQAKKSSTAWLTKLHSRVRKINEPMSLATQVDIKASPNDSYYIHVVNTATMRSWKHK